MTTTIRKLTIALGAAVAFAATATAASAAPHWGHGHYGFYGFPAGFGVGYYASNYVAAPNCYVARQVVYTPYGKRYRKVTVCE